MRIIELIKLLLENKDLIMQLVAFISQFFGDEPVVFSAMAAEEKFPELAAALAAEGTTMDELADAVQAWKDEQPTPGGES